MTEGFIMLQRSAETMELLRDGPAFLLLTLIALRARRTTTFNRDNLRPGEAFIGDCQSCGLTVRQYRTAKKHLERWRLVEFRATNKGTIARICDATVYDVNPAVADRPMTSARQTSDKRATTNNNENNETMKKEDALVLGRHRQVRPDGSNRDFAGQHSALGRTIEM